MDSGAIPAPAEQQCGGETGEERGCILPIVAGGVCLLQVLPMDKVQLCSLSELGETIRGSSPHLPGPHLELACGYWKSLWH